MSNYRLRLSRIQQQLDAADVFLVFSPENRRYLTGFTGSNGQVLLKRDKVYFLTDGRYAKQAELEVTADEVVIYQKLGDAIKKIIGGQAVVGVFEAEGVTVAEWKNISEAAEITAWQAAPETLTNMRIAKDAGEVQKIKRAIEIAESAYAKVLPIIKAGVSEQQVALELEWRIRQSGSERVPFEFIVAAGERSALPHGRASTAKLKNGQSLTLDFGAEYEGYFSDMTFSGSVGQINTWIAEVIAILQEAQAAALPLCHSGVPVAEVDAAARKVIQAAGYGDAFKHSLGHGVGLAIHEAPKLSALSKEVLCEGAVVTIEPGIYVEGKGGARLEDMVLVGATAPELLTTISKQHILWS